MDNAFLADTLSYAGHPWLIILAAGRGERLQNAGLSCRKQFIPLGDYPLYWHCALAASRVARLKGIIFVLPEDMLAERSAEISELARQNPLGLPRVVVAGSPRLRQESVAAGLAALPPECDSVLIHDAARPLATPALYNAVLNALAGGAPGVVPGLALVDTIKQVAADGEEGLLVRATLPREELVAVQTPQGFSLEILRAAHARAAQEGWEVTDDAALLERCGQKVLIVPGEADNLKITTLEDLARLAALGKNGFPSRAFVGRRPAPESCAAESAPEMPLLPNFSGSIASKPQNYVPQTPCAGFGYDVHRYAEEGAPKARPMKLGGVPIPGAPHIEAHSDGDVLLHALMDAILGCLGAGDIGGLFPDTDERFAGVDSALLLSEVMALADKAGLALTHVDLTVIAQVPKISPHRELMRKNLCALLHLDSGSVNVKATTEERLGFTGRKEGIKAVAVVSALK